MISLLIETSTERGLLALFRGKTLIYHGKQAFGLQNSTTLLPEMAKAFDVCHLRPTDIQLVMSGIGPGSYTGIRVAAMIAKTLAFTLQVPLVGICSLDGFVPEQEGSFASVIDARISGVYLQTGSRQNGKIHHLSGPKLCSLEEAVDLLKETKTIMTPNSLLLRPKFERLSPNIEWNFMESDPDPIQMGLAGFAKYENKEFGQDPKLDLLYLRKTQAEIEKDAGI